MQKNSSTIRSLSALKALVVECFEFAPYKVMLALAVMLATSLTSGVGILMIIPLTSSIGVDFGITSSAGIADAISEFANYIGVDLNLISVLVLYLVLISCHAILNFLNATIFVSLTQSFTVHLRARMAKSLFYSQWGYLNQRHMPDFMRMLIGEVRNVSVSMHLLLTLAGNVILVFVYFLLSIALSFKLTAIAAVCGVGLIALLWPINKVIQSSGGMELLANQNIYRSFFENLNGLKLIKSFAAEDKYLERMKRSNKALEFEQVRMARISAISRLFNTVGAAFIFTLLIYISVHELALPIENLLLIILIFSRLMPLLIAIQGNLQSLLHNSAAYQNFVDKSNELVQWQEVEIVNSTQSEEIALSQKLTIKNLSLRYEGNVNHVFKHLNATIPAYQTSAILGSSGIGKSSLADILSGLISPTEGTFYVDDVAIDEKNRLGWRKQIAYVNQDGFLFNDSIRNNLMWVFEAGLVDEEQKEERIWRALKLAAADKFVQKLTKGLDTHIGDRGVRLSGGERQRIALARALLSEPQLLILDEATSALDRKNEIRIRDALMNLDGKLTMVVIAHNETSIEYVRNRIYL